MSARFLLLFHLTPYFFRSAHWQKEVEISDEEDASSSEGTAYEQEKEDTSEDDEVEDPRVYIFACARGCAFLPCAQSVPPMIPMPSKGMICMNKHSGTC
jgi:hypothetical protein